MFSLAADLSSNAWHERVADDRAVTAPSSPWASQRSVFLYGFAKSERDDINDRELDDLKKLARHYLNYSDAQIATALERLELIEVTCNGQEKN